MARDRGDNMKKRLIKQFLPIWEELDKIEDVRFKNINYLEKTMKELLGEEYEFAWVEGNIVGIGMVKGAKSKLIIQDFDFANFKERGKGND